MFAFYKQNVRKQRMELEGHTSEAAKRANDRDI